MGLGRGEKQDKVSNYMVNEGQKTVFMIIYFAINFLFFFVTYSRYRAKEELYRKLGDGLTVARGAAACLSFNCAMLLLPVCRNFVTWLRGTFAANYVPLDKNVRLHKTIAWLILAFGLAHGISHYFNYYNLAKGDNAANSAAKLAFGTVAGFSGHMIVTIMFLIYTTAWSKVRRDCFELFWFTHHLFILWFALILFHGSEGALQPTQFWAWFMGPGMLYACERVIRYANGYQATEVLRIVQHPSKVFELQMVRGTGTEYKTGQYLFLNCPTVAKQEWHPFTITSSPEEDYISVHVRIVGDWTKDVAAFLGLAWTKEGQCVDQVDEEGVMKKQVIGQVFRFDGPFGAASEDVLKYKYVMLVGAGIGVTPFASVLKTIWYHLLDEQPMHLRKLYFVWVARDKEAFEWFSDLLEALERENLEDFIDIRVYLTAPMKEAQVRDIMFAEDAGGPDAITGLRAPTHFGRPNWEEIFQELSRNHENEVIGVFLCGPKVISGILHRLSNKYTKIRSGVGTRFVYNKENF